MAPEYAESGMISKKADIFSFGVVILELLTGSKSEYPQSEASFKGFTDGVVEKWRNRLSNAGYSQQVSTCVLIALNCLDVNRDKRPTTECIIKRLNGDQEPNSSSSCVQNNPKRVAIDVGAVVLIWALVIATLNKVTTYSRLAIGGPAIRLVTYLKNHCNSRPQMILFTMGATLAAVLALLITESERCFIYSSCRRSYGTSSPRPPRLRRFVCCCSACTSFWRDDSGEEE